MKKAVSIWSFGGDTSLEGKLRLARRAGFDGFEIDLSADGPLTLASTSRDIRAVRNLAARVGIELSGLATGMYWGANPASDRPAVRAKARIIVRRQIAVARELGLDAVLVVPGTVGADFI